MTDPRDIALQMSCPVVAVPRFGPLPEMEKGQRLLVAANGIHLQVKTDWLECAILVGGVDIALPFGEVRPSIRCAFGKMPGALLREFVGWARAALPDEVAAVLVFEPASGNLRLERCEALWQSADGVGYRLPPLADDEVVAVDLHSHGHATAYFSPTDDADDVGIKIAGVFGNVDQPEPTSRLRLVVGRSRIDLPCPAPLFATA